jgi:hypothetical protein
MASQNIKTGETTTIGIYQATSGTTNPKFDLTTNGSTNTHCVTLAEDCNAFGVVEVYAFAGLSNGCNYEVDLPFCFCSYAPSLMPSESPSGQPSDHPSETPSCTPSHAPTPSPSINLFYLTRMNLLVAVQHLAV